MGGMMVVKHNLLTNKIELKKKKYGLRQIKCNEEERLIMKNANQPRDNSNSPNGLAPCAKCADGKTTNGYQLTSCSVTSTYAPTAGPSPSHRVMRKTTGKEKKRRVLPRKSVEKRGNLVKSWRMN